jgi:hypothetical protein
VYPDSSCCRDKVNGAAGRRAVGSVFCSPFIKFTVTSKSRFHYRDSYVIGFYRDKTPCVHLPGLAKNSPTLTRTAPNYTTEPLGVRVSATPSPSSLENFILMGQFSVNCRDSVIWTTLSRHNNSCHLPGFEHSGA